jgi:hypothetical protein
MPITLQTSQDEQKTIRKLNRGELGEDVSVVLDPIMVSAIERANRRLK